jgi:serine/threonine protein kinase
LVTYGNEDDVEPPEEGQAPSALWPSAADGRSGMRGKSSGDLPASSRGPLPYRLLSPIGTTAYGRAYRALHLVQNRDVALHYLPLAPEGDSAHARELPLLVAKCAQLSHHNVVAVEEHGRDDASGGAHFVVTEPLEGVALAAVLEDMQTLPLARALTITLQIGRALRAAHKLGVVHGALTPASVRLVQSEQGERVRVVGFGALMLAPPSLRLPGTLDSRPYDAPECAHGAPADPCSDVFSIASLLFQMLTGAAPRVRDDVPRLSALSPEPVPRELEELVSRCLEPRPEARVADVVSFVRKLREIARSIDVTGAMEGRRSSISDSSLPPQELPPAENETSGSLFGVESIGARQGAVWIVAGLLLALAAVWLLWRASAHGPIELTPGKASHAP